MTQKECLYVEDAIGHEQVMIQVLTEGEKQLQEKALKNYVNEEIKTHKQIIKELKKVLEESRNE